MGTEGISILDAMVSETMETAGGAAPKRTVTPLPGEVVTDSVLPRRTPAMFPFDQPVDGVATAIAELDRAIESLQKTKEGLQLLLGVPEITQKEIDRQKQEQQRAIEREADRRAAAGDESPLAPVVEAAEAALEKRAMVLSALADAGGPGPEAVVSFSERFAALAKDAQDATFSEPIQGAGPADPWVCPVHGSAITKKSPRRGVEFRACPECNQFEKV